MKKIRERLRNEPALVAAAILAVVEATQGLSGLSAVRIGLVALLRFVVSPAKDVGW